MTRAAIIAAAMALSACRGTCRTCVDACAPFTVAMCRPYSAHVECECDATRRATP